LVFKKTLFLSKKSCLSETVPSAAGSVRSGVRRILTGLPAVAGNASRDGSEKPFKTYLNRARILKLRHPTIVFILEV
jgi:hypothetical protein